MPTTITLCASDRCRPPSAGGPRPAGRGTPLCDPCCDQAWEALQSIARVYPETEAQLTAPNKGGYDRSGGKTTRAPGIDLNPRVVEARQDITNTLTFWVHVLLDEHATLTGPVADPTAHARFIGSNLRHLTHHHDHGLATSIAEDTHRLAKLVISIAYPKGARRYEPGIPCVEHDTDDMGARVPCQGEYQAWVWDGMGHRPNLVCNVDTAHVVEPAGFRSLARRITTDQAVRNLANTISGRMSA